MTDEIEVTDTESTAAEPSLDEFLNSKMDEIDAREEPAAVKERTRNESGQFAAKTDTTGEPVVKAVTDTSVTSAEASPVATADVVQPPATWTQQAKAKFAALDPEIQQEVVKREKEIARTVTAQDQDRLFGKSLRDMVGPYLPMINAESSTPEAAINSLLNTAYRLRTSSPQEKGVLLANLARQYGADMSAFNADGSQDQSPIDPTVAALQQKLQQLEGFISQQHTQQQTATEQNLLRDINAFAADPSHSYFEQVGQQMAGLIKSGLAADLQQAYDQAIYMHPDVRQKVFAAQQAETQKKQIEDAQRKADAARKSAVVNLRGKPSLPAKIASGTVEQTLNDAYERIMGVA